MRHGLVAQRLARRGRMQADAVAGVSCLGLVGVFKGGVEGAGAWRLSKSKGQDRVEDLRQVED